MSVLKVARLGHPVLRQIAQPVDLKQLPDNGEIQTLIDDMIDTMRD
ncbi:MAG: peptide deformylase, partial [Nitrospinaceae bacterium]|nr:peptide deformylase [Nitrospinaceae bacterium]NIR53573.1 peptide deformylase [Nitrospinaceae bacterium]NIS83974.1 peptide deformylase [Nitrospinaceae bacterium]NIT80783.1 peptide deformylase [Nitrospinaceae bacterium]NIU43089.1 peptide deformylase [Nitrospinaceae bacterium]